MSEEATRATVKDLYASYVARDFTRVAALIADDVDWIIYAPIHIFPFAGHRAGKAAVLAALGGIETDYSIESYVPKVMIAEDDWASVMSDVAFKQRSTCCASTSQTSCACVMGGSWNSASSRTRSTWSSRHSVTNSRCEPLIRAAPG